MEIDSTLLQTAIESSDDGMCIADATQPDRPIVYVNRGFERLTGYSRGEIIGQNCRFLQADDVDQPGLDVLRDAMNEGRPIAVQVRNYRKDGSLFWNQVSISPIFDAENRLTHFVAFQKDVTDRVVVQLSLRERERELTLANDSLRKLADRDSLTGLFCRRYLLETLSREWKGVPSAARTVCLFMVDVDDFKKYNDTYGHLAGDTALATIAGTLQRVFGRSSDLVARFGGEEFAIATTSNKTAEIPAIAERVRLKIESLGIEHAGTDIANVLTVSVGAAAVHPANSSLEDGLRAADHALYTSKNLGRNQFTVWPTDEQEGSEESARGSEKVQAIRS